MIIAGALVQILQPKTTSLAAMTSTERKIKSIAGGRGFHVDPEDIWSFSRTYISL